MAKKPPAAKKQPKPPKAVASNAASKPNGFAFGDPQFSPDDYTNFTTAQRMADTSEKAVLQLQPIPKLRKDPPIMSLAGKGRGGTLNSCK